nr:MAG TPA: hypothetical protein [Caudoviricetes sp.]
MFTKRWLPERSSPTATFSFYDFSLLEILDE